MARVLEPTSVALIGASDRAGTIGSAITRNLLAGGFSGDLHLVNRRGGTVAGHALRRSVLDVEGRSISPSSRSRPQRCVEVARECAAKGVGALVVISAGFAEVGGEGAQRQHELLEVCRATGMRLVGPNCLGVAEHRPAVG